MQTFGMICAIAMPFFNIPLIHRIWKRKSSEDISLVWVIGAWLCIVGMTPASLTSLDPVLRAFGVVNILFFTGVLVSVLIFHPRVRSLFRKKT